MILKASQRSGGKQLALHLLKTEENEHLQVHEIRGFVSDDVVAAMKEAHAVSKGTKCKQFLFSVSLNPPEKESVPTDVFEKALDRIEKKVGLTGHPRVVVFHEKHGRRHCHAVWSRIDTETMTAVNLSHYKLKMREISRELFMEHGWKMPHGLMNSAEADPRNFTLDQWQQAKRAGWNAREIKSLMQECWAVSDSRAAFAEALKERGLMLARGDRRSHVVITHDGKVLSVARYTGKPAKSVRAKLGEPDDLPSVAEAKAQFAKDMAVAMKRHTDEANSKKSEALSRVEVLKAEVTAQHQSERTRLIEEQNRRWAEESRARAERFKSGLGGLWQRVTGAHVRIVRENESAEIFVYQTGSLSWKRMTN